MKAKYPGVNLNKRFTVEDLRLGSLLVNVVLAHRNTIAQGGKFDGYLNEKLAQAIKDRRIDNRKAAKQKN